MQIKFHSFLTIALDRSDWSPSWRSCFTSQGKSPKHPMGGPHSQSGGFGKEKRSLALSWALSWVLSCLVHSMVTILTMVCWFPIKMVSQTFIMNKSISKYSHISDPQKITKILVLILPQLSMAFMTPPRTSIYDFDGGKSWTKQNQEVVKAWTSKYLGN